MTDEVSISSSVEKHLIRFALLATPDVCIANSLDNEVILFSPLEKAFIRANIPKNTDCKFPKHKTTVNGTETATVVFIICLNQWWKSLIPVIAIAMPYLLQTSMTLSSLIDPPG